MRGSNLRHVYKTYGARTTVGKLSEALRQKKVHPREFSIRELAEATMGENWQRKLNSRNMQYVYNTERLRSLRESDIRAIPEDTGDAVDVSAFSNITGQIVFSMIHEGWEQAGMIGDKIFKTVPTKFDGEKIPGIGRVTQEGNPIHPGDEYPRLGFGEQYWETPSTTKHGFIVEVSKETVFFDRTNLILARAQEAGERLRYNKEKRQLAVVAGVTVQLGTESFNGNNHKWKGTTYNTYDTSANAIGINSKSSTELLDWTDIEELWLLASDLRDPDTNNPILVQHDCLIVQPYKLATAMRIMNATEVRVGDITTGTGTQTIADNPLVQKQFGNMNVMSSPLLYQLIVDSGISTTNARNWWFMTQKDKAFWYMENWPLTVAQAPANNEAEFTRDVVLRFKASERGVPYSADPRYTLKGYAS